MKRLTAFWLSACFLCTIPVQAQSFIPERDSSDISLFEYATKIPKRNNVFNLDLEMHASFNTFFTGHKLDEAAFRFNHIKIEATGEVNDRLFYWYRQNLNQGNEGMDLENLSLRNKGCKSSICEIYTLFYTQECKIGCFCIF